jgi:hypothetical protein
MGIKGIVSRNVKYFFWYHSRAWKFLHFFYSIRFLKYRRFHVEFLNIRRSAVSFY